jgi:hypothetical protein
LWHIKSVEKQDKQDQFYKQLGADTPIKDWPRLNCNVYLLFPLGFQ